MTTTSDLVQHAIIAATTEMDSDVELFGVPVDLPGRAVVFATAPVRLVIKVDKDPTRILREKHALVHFADLAPVARHWFDTGTDPWVLATSYIDGERMSPSTPAEAWVDLGRNLAKIHLTPSEGFTPHPSDPTTSNRWATQLATEARDSGLVDSKIATAFLTQTVSETVSDRATCVIHGDLTPDHVFYEQHRVSGLIDFGDCGIGDPAYDLATATLWNQDKLDLVLAGYAEAGAVLKQDAGLEADIKRFQLMRLLSGALWLHSYEFATAPYISELYERLIAGLTES